MRQKEDRGPNKITDTLRKVEKALIVQALRKADGRVSEAAKALNVNRTDMYERMLRLGIPKPEKRRPPLSNSDLMRNFMGN